jgi:hypothetical protein
LIAVLIAVLVAPFPRREDNEEEDDAGAAARVAPDEDGAGDAGETLNGPGPARAPTFSSPSLSSLPMPSSSSEQKELLRLLLLRPLLLLLLLVLLLILFFLILLTPLSLPLSLLLLLRVAYRLFSPFPLLIGVTHTSW